MIGRVAICLRHRARLFVWEWPFTNGMDLAAHCNDCNKWAWSPPRDRTPTPIVFCCEEEIAEILAYDLPGAVSVPDGEAGALALVREPS